MENGQILWEGELLTGGRKGEPVKVRIMFHRGQWLDEFGQLGPDIKAAILRRKNRRMAEALASRVQRRLICNRSCRLQVRMRWEFPANVYASFPPKPHRVLTRGHVAP